MYRPNQRQRKGKVTKNTTGNAEAPPNIVRASPLSPIGRIPRNIRTITVDRDGRMAILPATRIRIVHLLSASRWL